MSEDRCKKLQEKMMEETGGFKELHIPPGSREFQESRF